MTQPINVASVIDSERIGGFQLKVFLLCASVLFVDGFDVQGITYVAPAISREWKLGRGAFGPTFSAGLFGLMLGAILLAPLADRIGRRRVIVWSCATFGLCTLLTVWMPSLGALLVLRFFTGLGLGSALPNAIGLASEYAPERRRALVVMFVGSGISIGSIASGMVAAQVVMTRGWRSLFVVGGTLPLLLAAVLSRSLPESIRFAALLPRGQEEARRLLHKIRPTIDAEGDVRIVSGDAEGGKATVADLFRERRGPATLALWVAFFMSLLNVYLAINWLPTSLNASGFTVTQAAFMTSLYHFGGVAGTYAIGLLMDRLGRHTMVLFALLLALIGFYAFASLPEMAQWPTSAVLMLAGFGVIGAQVGLTALSAITYPVAMRSTGLGWALGVGRVGSIVGPTVGGWLLATASNPRSVYAVCIVPVLIGMASIALLKRQSSRSAASLPVALEKEQVH
jgi:AAHS family 4-hydroxybenzoate transporter-like MFS transporter